MDSNILNIEYNELLLSFFLYEKKDIKNLNENTFFFFFFQLRETIYFSLVIFSNVQCFRNQCIENCCCESSCFEPRYFGLMVQRFTLRSMLSAQFTL